jgi:hypothetical protein
MKISLYKKGLVVWIIVLFFLIGISPVINANSFKTINDNKLDEITSNVINADGNNEIFCEILKRIGIFIEELGKKFPEGTVIYPILVLMMFPWVILWNKYCYEFFVSYDLSLTRIQQENHMIFQILAIRRGVV